MNSPKIPPSYLPGLQTLEAFSATEMAVWLIREVRELEHLLVGGHDDQPVQAILNHARYLSGSAKKLLTQAVQEYLHDWKVLPERHEPKTIWHLLHLAVELPLPGVKGDLMLIFQDERHKKVPVDLLGAVLGTIANLSVETDASFWIRLAEVEDFPQYAGMAFQVLLRTSPPDDLELLYKLIPDKSVAGSVVRGLSNHLIPAAKPT